MKNLEAAKALLTELSERCLVIGPFWLYSPEGSQEHTVKFELQAFMEGLNLAYVQALVAGKGAGRAALEHVCRLADKHHCPIILHVDPDHGTPRKVLVKLYSDLGFVRRPKHTRDAMWRLPRS